MIKVEKGELYLPGDLDKDVPEIIFSFLLYINYNPKINDYESYKSNLEHKNGTSLDLNNKSRKINKIKRRLNIFEDIGDFFSRNYENIIEKVILKEISTVYVALVKYLINGLDNLIINTLSDFICDEIGEFIGEGITTLIFNSVSKSEEDYKENF